jgi:anti-sigma B factor antagonist
VRFEVVELSPTANKVVMIGRLDSATVGGVEIPFTAAISAAGKNAVLDMRQLDFLSSLGIRLLLSSARVVTRRGGKVILFGAQPMVGEVLSAMALDSVLPHVATEEEAVARLGS